MYDYHIIEHIDPDGKKWYGMHKIIQTDAGKISSIQPASIITTDPRDPWNDMMWEVQKMREAINRNIIFEKDLPKNIDRAVKSIQRKL